MSKDIAIGDLILKVFRCDFLDYVKIIMKLEEILDIEIKDELASIN